jgi:hypothetical protein
VKRKSFSGVVFVTQSAIMSVCIAISVQTILPMIVEIIIMQPTEINTGEIYGRQ